MGNIIDNDDKQRMPSYRTDVSVDVKNEYVYADHPTGISVNAMRLLRIAIAQCRKGDDKLYEYTFNIPDLAEMIGCDKHNLYRIADTITDQLMRVLLKTGEMKPGQKGMKRHIFDKCDYDNGEVILKLHPDMEYLLLNLGRRFTKIPLEPILIMRSKYGIRLYELICQKMMGNHPYSTVATSVEVSLEDVRTVTGTAGQKSYDVISNLKRRVLMPALEDIEKAADWKIKCHDIKKSRTIKGFCLEIWTAKGFETIEDCKKNGIIPPQPVKEVPGQLSLFDL